ncbi:hypothetical protein MRX96_035952 [Rhipicephalus microplus]
MAFAQKTTKERKDAAGVRLLHKYAQQPEELAGQTPPRAQRSHQLSSQELASEETSRALGLRGLRQTSVALRARKRGTREMQRHGQEKRAVSGEKKELGNVLSKAPKEYREGRGNETKLNAMKRYRVTDLEQCKVQCEGTQVRRGKWGRMRRVGRRRKTALLVLWKKLGNEERG